MTSYAVENFALLRGRNGPIAYSGTLNCDWSLEKCKKFGHTEK
jgi:hypothetical protein